MITVFHLVARGELETLANANTPKGKMRDIVRVPFLTNSAGMTFEAADKARRNLQISAAIALRIHGEYVDVAVIDTDDLEDAFTLTNTVDQSWIETTDPRVTLTGKNQIEQAGRKSCYSTSVGDLMRNDATNEFFLCAPLGWVSLGDLDDLIEALLDDPSMGEAR